MRAGLSDNLIKRLLPDLKYTTQEIEAKYPPRNLPEGADVVRIGPSPTGMMHLGTLYQAVVNRKIADQSKGVFFVRVEDTDSKRLVDGAIDVILNAMPRFGIKFDEGIKLDGAEAGNYGPYIQSKRKDIYITYLAELLKVGKAYPCFMTEEEIAEITDIQSKSGNRTGIYGEYAKNRDLSEEQIIEKLESGKKPVFRLYSEGNADEKTYVKDLVRGSIAMPQNDLDVVLLKSDGLPTYHFAHTIDDHLMGTTIVIRGIEWLASLPLHYQLFETMGWNPTKYAHLSTIDKLDNEGNRKKLSKRENEANVFFFTETGFEPEAVLEYLYQIASSAYAEGKVKNPNLKWEDINLNLKKINQSGALFDMKKLESISKDFISTLDNKELYNRVKSWIEEYNPDWKNWLKNNEDYLFDILSIERENPKRIRKDFITWSQTLGEISYFRDDLFDLSLPAFLDVVGKKELGEIKNILKEIRDNYSEDLDSGTWFEGVREIGLKYGYAKNLKEQNAEPEKYVGNVSDVAGFLRVALTGRLNTPDIYSIMKVMGKDRVLLRIDNIIK